MMTHPSTLAFFLCCGGVGVDDFKILGSLSLSMHVWENVESKLLVHLKPSRHKEEDTQQSSRKLMLRGSFDVVCVCVREHLSSIVNMS